MDDTIRKAYNSLVERLEESGRLHTVSGLIHWDQEVIMPKGGADSRAKQISALAGVIHEKDTHEQIGEALNILSHGDTSRFTLFEKANIREAQWEYNRAVRVPGDLVRELADTV